VRPLLERQKAKEDKMKKNILATMVVLAGITASGVAVARGFGQEGGGRGGPAGFDFAAVDADGDGKITPAEMQAFRQAEIAGLDADGNGLISAEEMVAKQMVRMQARAEEMAKARIEAQDSNGDGQLSAAEMAMPGMPTGMFERLDTDKDGAISTAELDAAREKMGDRRGQGHGKGDGEHRGRGGRGWMGSDGDDN
jgi:hypothetical protein